GRTEPVCGLAGVGAGGWSAGRVTVPFRLKFLSSLGPTVSVAGVLVVGAGAGAVVLCASAAAGARDTPHASNTAVPRKIALIRSRSCLIRRITPPRRSPANARCVPSLQALGR